MSLFPKLAMVCQAWGVWNDVGRISKSKSKLTFVKQVLVVEKRNPVLILKPLSLKRNVFVEKTSFKTLLKRRGKESMKHEVCGRNMELKSRPGAWLVALRKFSARDGLSFFEGAGVGRRGPVQNQGGQIDFRPSRNGAAGRQGLVACCQAGAED